jgi:hypothetical protein
VALWDFVHREGGPGGEGRFIAYTARDDPRNYALEARNIARDYWNKGRQATYGDLPLLGRGPFGQAVRFGPESDKDFRPCLIVPRSRMHDSPLDIKGAGKSVSLVAWIILESGDHGIAGIWHEGTDLSPSTDRAVLIENGRRQYALFAGLRANPGGVGAHLSENGRSSFTDRYARTIAVTSETSPVVASDAPAEQLDAGWTMVSFSFDNAGNTATSFLNGSSGDYWIDDPAVHPMYRWQYKGWKQAQLHKIPGEQPGEDAAFPAEQYYDPPEASLLDTRIVSETADEKVVINTYDYTRVRITYHKAPGGAVSRLRRSSASTTDQGDGQTVVSLGDRQGDFTVVADRDLVGLKVNPYWFGHDLYAPLSADDGGPFSIGKVLTSGRGNGIAGFFGAVALFDRALTDQEMALLAGIGRKRMQNRRHAPDLLQLRDILAGRD